MKFACVRVQSKWKSNERWTIDENPRYRNLCRLENNSENDRISDFLGASENRCRSLLLPEEQITSKYFRELNHKYFQRSIARVRRSYNVFSFSLTISLLEVSSFQECLSDSEAVRFKRNEFSDLLLHLMTFPSFWPYCVLSVRIFDRWELRVRVATYERLRQIQMTSWYTYFSLVLISSSRQIWSAIEIFIFLSSLYSTRH